MQRLRSTMHRIPKLQPRPKPPPKRLPKPKATPKAAAKAKATPKAAAKAKAKAKSAPKAAAKARALANASAEEPMLEPAPKRAARASRDLQGVSPNPEMVKKLVGIMKKHGGKTYDETKLTLHHQDFLPKVRMNIYWTRDSAGVTLYTPGEAKKDVAHFGCKTNTIATNVFLARTLATRPTYAVYVVWFGLLLDVSVFAVPTVFAAEAKEVHEDNGFCVDRRRSSFCEGAESIHEGCSGAVQQLRRVVLLTVINISAVDSCWTACQQAYHERKAKLCGRVFVFLGCRPQDAVRMRSPSKLACRILACTCVSTSHTH